MDVCGKLGAKITEEPSRWLVAGTKNPQTDAVLDAGNSGTTLFLGLAIAALGEKPVTFTGDEQLRKRSAANLIEALRALGAKIESGENGCAPITVQGPCRGGKCRIECPTSQYLSALLLAAPLAPQGVVTEIEVPLLNEKPYIEMTLSYLERQRIPYEKAKDFSFFRINGGAAYAPMNGPVTADFSSAAFPAAAAVVSKGKVTLSGLDPCDTQGDKVFFDILAYMGAFVEWKEPIADEWEVTVEGTDSLKAGIFDLNATPDLLPIMAVVAAFAEGETLLTNVAHARLKETDRITAMARELGKLGVYCEEKQDGLLIRGGKVQGGKVDGRGDHRIVMALACAGLGAESEIEISGAEASGVTYPDFLNVIGASFS
jgi:3-phosphoshikimate 1-carboxyvinyltransferase